MILNGRMQVRPSSSKSFNLKGGLNTEIANMERGPGELLVCQNYNVISGAYSGYQSTKGYEIFDGTALTSETALETVSNWKTGTAYVEYDRVSNGGFVYVCAIDHTSGTFATDLAAVKWTLEAVQGEEDFYKDVKREAERATKVALLGNGKVRGLHIYDDEVYGWQNDIEAASYTQLYVEDAVSGWAEIDPLTVDDKMNPNGEIQAITSRFQNYESNNEVMYWVSGVDDGFFKYNGTDDYSNITHANLPTFAVEGVYPEKIGTWENRIFIVYPTGDIFFSNPGDPSDFDSATGTAGQMDMGSPVTGIISTAGVLIVFTRKGTKIVRYGSTTSQLIFDIDEHSKNTGALDGTVDSHTESVIFCSDTDVHRMVPSAETGGFSTESLSDKITQAYLDIKDSITTTLIDNKHSRYYILYDNAAGNASYGYTFTIYKNRLKGVGSFRFKDKMVISTQGILSDGTDMILTGGTDGTVYKLESGTSYNGDTIDCRFTTSYYHYGSPRNWKNFQRLVFEVTNDTTTTYSVAPVFDYGEGILARHGTEDNELTGGASTWGEGILWGSFLWGASELGKAVLYIQGHAQNMAITLRTTNKYGGQHTVHNITTDFTREAPRQ